MEGLVYYVFNEGELIFATDDEEVAEDYAAERLRMATLGEIEESGRDEEDLTAEEYAEFEYIAGYNGDCYEVGCVDVPKDYDEDAEFDVCPGSTATFYELSEVYTSSEDLEDDNDYED